MIALDTNILARFYCDDPDDPEAVRQRPIAKAIVLESESLFVPKTVVLELEWVMRGFYGLATHQIASVIEHLLGMEHALVEDWQAVKDALDAYRQGLDLADALHLASAGQCEAFYTFDRRRFATRARRLGLSPPTVAC